VGGNYSSNGNGVPPDPVQYSCQKNFVIIVTDGEPTKDDFDVESPTDTTAGYANFTSLIGNYNSADGETEVQADLVCTGCETALYLDDIAKFMQENDFRPDMPGIQVIDTYAIGFSASPGANTLLAKTASVGNGIFFAAKDEAALAQAIIDSLSDIIEKAQSFTAATVPASRTAAGDHLYVSLFTPTSKTPYWNGRLRSYRLTVDGEVEDANGNCALDDPSGNCFTGTFLPTNTNPPFWDAATAVPAAFSRDLMTSRINSGTSSPEVVDFKHTADSGPLAATDLGVTTFPPTNPYTGSIATDAEELTAEIIASVRGCDFGTGANSVACVSRANRLSDIFHANPVVVGQPAAYFPDQTYKDWVANISGDRDRVIFAGSNGGFLHGFNAGTWNSAATPPVYTAGDGAERFGFMPWSARQNIANLPNDTGNRDYYFVDGSPSVADAWLWTTGNANQATPSAQTQWRTVLVSGMRQGGHSYFALDVTEPGATSCAAPAMGSKYPCYLWEFPREDDSGAFQALVGETWGDPIITRIKLDVNGTVVDRWVAVVTGGYHATGDPNDHASYDPNGTLGRSIWILDLSTGEPLAMRSVDLSGSGCSAAYDPANPELHMCYAFAATPAVYDIDGDGYSDMIVAVDLGGQVWKWVINGVGWDPNNTTKTLADNDTAWPLRKFFEAPIYQASGGSPKFYKSLFHAPAATLKSGTLWYAFGSGERNELLHAGDSATTADNNRMYSMKDVDPLDAGSPTTVLTESNLTNLTAVTGCPDLSAVSGFYFVGAEGEKWVTEFDLFSYWVLASSYIPVPSNDPCTIGGAASLYAFRVYCGDGFFPGPSGTTTRSTSIGGGLPTDPKVSIAPGQNGATRVIISKQGGEIENVDFGNAFGPGIGVFYWRELQN
jgi:type IV pilus assembly protein PilY1